MPRHKPSIPETIKKLRAERRKETRLAHRLKAECDKLRKGLRQMTAFADRLRASVAKLATVEQSVEDLLKQLVAQIRDNVEDPVALNAILDEVEAKTAEIAQDVVDNTPAAG